MKAIIIDDEPDCVGILSLQLKMYCPTVTVVAECTQSIEGLKKIQEHKPDIVFLDIEMPRMNGFQLLEALGDFDFSLVFVTAYDRFAVKAFRFSAIDYLLKPVEGNDLLASIKKAEKRQRIELNQLNLLKQHYQSPEKNLPEKIALPYQNTVVFTKISEIVYCQADNNYTKVFISSGQSYLISKTLRDIQEILEERNFLRIHRQFLVNVEHIVKYVKGEGNYIILSNGQSIPVAQNQKDKLVEKFGWL